MNKSVILLITAVTAISLTGCWGTATETDSETANSAIIAQGNLSETTNIDVNVVNNPPENAQNIEPQPMVEIQTNKVGNHVRTGDPGEDPTGMKEAEKRRQYKLAAESSLISNEMNKDGNPVQTRQFGNNPILKKVEIISFSEKERKILVYLKDGKVLPMTQGKLPDPMVATSYQILKAVGVEPPAPPPTMSVEKKKEQN